MNFKRLSIKFLSMLIVTVMLFSVAAPVVSATGVLEDLHSDKAGNEKLHYVSLGASNTNGFGHHGYLDPEIYEDPLAANKFQMNDYGYDKAPANAYPALIRDALAEKTGREVELHQLAISSMRVEEVLWLLDDTFEPDEYMNWRFTDGKSWFDMAKKEYDETKYSSSREALRGEYRDYIANADVITVDLGWNNFGVYAFNNIMTILKEGGSRYWNAPAFDKVIEAGMEEEYYAIRDKVIERLNENVDLSGTALSEKVIQMLADVLAYATFGACYNFDKVIEKIYELNPDANVVVINVQNLADELVVNLDGTELPLGDLYGELIEFVDLYRASMSPNADKYGFAYAGEDGDVDTFLDEFRLWDGDPTTLSQDMKDLFDMYDDNLYVRSKIEYMMVGQVLGVIFNKFGDIFNDFDLTGQYEYTFALDMAWLNGVDLGELDFNNPDTPLEEYGAAVSKHLYNLRNYYNDIDPETDGIQQGRDAYKYVFDTMQAYYTEQSGNAAYAEELVKGYKSQFDQAMLGLYIVYNNTLNYAYDTVGTIIQYSLQFNVFQMTPDSMDNHNGKTDELLGYVVNTFTNNTMAKFYYELGAIGLGDPAPEAPEITVNEELFSDPLIQAVAALEVRYDFGNSFFAHPSVKGMKQIRDAVMDVLANDSHADSFTDKKLNQYIDLVEYYLNPYYQEKYAELKANGTIDAMLSGLDATENALNALESALLENEIPSDLDIDHERAEEIKALLLEEIENTRETVAGLRKLLNTDTLAFDTSDYNKLIKLQRHLADHGETIGALALEIGYFAEPYVNEIVRVTELYAGIIADASVDAYEYLVNTVEGFAEGYVEFVEVLGSYADKVDPELGAAIRAYLLDTPSDAIRIICEYGKDAVIKFIVDASATTDEIYSSLATIALILAEHGEKIYNEITSDEEFKTLAAAIELKARELMELYRSACDSPALVALDIDKIAAKQKAELEVLYTQLAELVVKNVKAYDEEVAELLWTALTDALDAFIIVGPNGEQYIEWLGTRTEAMLGALAYSFIQNTDEFTGSVDAVIWKHLNAFDKLITNTVNDIETQIRFQLAILEAELLALGDCAKEVLAKIDAIKTMLDNGIADVKALVKAMRELVADVEALLEDLEDINAEKLLNCLDSLVELDALLDAIMGANYDEFKCALAQKALELLKKASPYIDEYLYDYFYNNPEEVIAFFEEYGHYIQKYADEYGYEIVGLLAYIYYAYGQDALIYAMENPEEALESVCAWYEKYGVRILPMVKVYMDALGIEYYTVEDLKAALIDLCEALDGLGAIWAPIVDELKAKIEAQIELLEAIGSLVGLEGLEMIVEYIKDQFDIILDDAINGEYEVNADSFYIAIAGNNSSYAELLAGALGLGDRYAVMGWDSIDATIVGKADLITLAYDHSVAEGFAAEQLLAAMLAYGNGSLREQVADYLDTTLGEILTEEKTEEYKAMVDEEIVKFLEAPEFAGKEVVDVDWSELVGEENVAQIEALLADVALRLEEQGITGDYVMPVDVRKLLSNLPFKDDFLDTLLGENTVFELSVPVVDLVLLTVESYLYANIMLHKTYAETIVDLIGINPDVQIALLGQYNPFCDINVMGVTIPLASVYENVVAVESAHSFAYAFLLPNVTYVDISDVETEWDALNVEEFIRSYIEDPMGVEFTSEADLYVTLQILGAYGLSCKHVYDGCEDLDCNICGELRDGAAHDYEAVVTEPDCVNGGYTTYTCKACGDSYVDDKVNALGHKFGDWVPFGEDKEERKCSVCGHTEYRDRIYDGNDDPIKHELTPIEKVAVVLGSVVVVAGVAAAVVALIKRRKNTK